MKIRKTNIPISTMQLRIFLAIFATLVAFYSITLSAVFLSLCIIFIAIQHLFYMPWTRSSIFRLLITPFIYISLLQATTLALWLVNKNYPLDTTPITLLIILAASSLYFSYITRGRAPRKQNIKDTTPVLFYDLLSIVSASIITAIVTLLPLFATGIGNISSILGLVNSNVDDLAHISMVNDRIQFDRGVLYHSDAASNLRTYSQVTVYPTSWHSANSVIMKVVNPDIKAGTDTIIAYVISKVFWFFILVFFFIRSVFMLHHIVSTKKKLSRLTIAWLTSAALYFAAYLLVDSFREGFYSFIPQLLAVSALIPFLVKTNDSDNTTWLSRHLLPITILCICGSLSWLLTLPLFAGVVLFIIVTYIDRSKITASFRTLLSAIVPFIPIYALLFIATLVQLYVSTRPSDASTLTFVESLNLRGPIALFPDILYYFIFIGVALLIAYTSRKILTQIDLVIALLTITLGFTALIYLIQAFTDGDPQYYYYKVLNTALIVALPLAITGFALMFDMIRNRKGSEVALYCCILLLLVTAVFIGFNKTVNPSGISSAEYLIGKRHSDMAANERTWKLVADQNQSKYRDNTYTFMYDPDPTLRTNVAYTNTMVLKANKPETRCFNDTLQAVVAADTSPRSIIDKIQSICKKDYVVTIIATGETYHEFKDLIDRSNLNDTIRIKDDSSIN